MTKMPRSMCHCVRSLPIDRSVGGQRCAVISESDCRLQFGRAWCILMVTMTTVSAIAAFLDEFAPPRLAAEWDNVGLLVGDARREVQRVMTCLTVTPQSVAEAVS